MTMQSTGFAALLSLLLLPLAGSALAADYDYDAEADFSGYRTFVFLEPSSGSQGRGGARGGQPGAQPKLSAILLKEVRSAIEAELGEKGLELGSRQEADLGISIHTGSERERVVHQFRGPRGRRRGKVVRTYQEGVLTIDMIDASSRALVWRGWEDAVLKDDPEKRQKQVEKLVAKILKNYPPED